MRGHEQSESHGQKQNITSPADILPHYLNKTIKQHSEPTAKNATEEPSLMPKVPELKQGNTTQEHDTKEEKEKMPQVLNKVKTERRI